MLVRSSECARLVRVGKCRFLSSGFCVKKLTRYCFAPSQTVVAFPEGGKVFRPPERILNTKSKDLGWRKNAGINKQWKHFKTRGVVRTKYINIFKKWDDKMLVAQAAAHYKGCTHYHPSIHPALKRGYSNAQLLYYLYYGQIQPEKRGTITRTRKSVVERMSPLSTSVS